MKATDKLEETPTIAIATAKKNATYFEQLASSFENADVAIMCNSLEGPVKTWNNACVEMFGYTSDEMIGKNISLIIPPQFSAKEKIISENIVNNKPVVKYESFRVRKNLESFQVAVVPSLLKNKAGEIIGVCEIIRDITVEKELEKNLISANIAIALQQVEKEKTAAELVISNLELAFQNKEKESRAGELSIANKELAFLNSHQAAFFASIVNSAAEAIFSKTLDGVILSWNVGAEKMFGYSAEEIIGKNVKILIPQHFRCEEDTSITQIKNDETLRFRTERLKKNGATLYASFTMAPIKDFKGNIIGASTIIRDLEEIKIAETQRKLLTKRLQIATQSVRLGIWDLDVEKNSITADPAMHVFFGLEETTFPWVFDVWISKIHPDDRQQVEHSLQTAVENEQNYNTEFRVVWNDSSVHYLRAAGVVERNDDGKGIGMIGACWDVTEKKEKDQHLKLLESVIINTTDAVLITEASPFDEPGPRILYVNEAFTKMTGYTAAEVIGKTPRILQGPKSDRQELKKLSEAIRNWQPYETSVINYKKNGEEFWINMSLTPVMNDNEVYTHWIAIERDITEHKLAEINLKQLNEDLKDHVKKLALSNEELEQFAFATSHDLQEPLRMVTSFLTQLERKYGDVLDDKAKKYIAFAVDGAKRMRQIILDLLEYSRVGKTNETEKIVDVNTIMADVQILLAKKIREKNAVLKIDNLPSIYAEITSLRQVFQNLITNALEYAVKDVPVQIHVTAKETGDFWQFAIADNGIGIDKEYYEKIFLIFQRLHTKEEHPGTGLGLAITKKIIETHGGKIWVESEEARPDDHVGRGKGSTFYFTIKK